VDVRAEMIEVTLSVEEVVGGSEVEEEAVVAGEMVIEEITTEGMAAVAMEAIAEAHARSAQVVVAVAVRG
jgi:hypothetical protein